MLNFFSKNRIRLLRENKFIKYLVYFLGETFLIVVGILIAVQINNWNETRKKDLQRKIYEVSLISELENDIDHLNDLDRHNIIKRNSIKNYFDYYNSEKPDLDILHHKLDSVNSTKIAFYTSAYTIDDLITTGNLSLFSKQKKASILKLKNTHDRYAFYETQTIQDVSLYEQEIKKNFDLLYLKGFSIKEHQDTKDWKQNLNSNQFRILNNSLVESLKLFEFQSDMYEAILEATSELRMILSEDSKANKQ